MKKIIGVVLAVIGIAITVFGLVAKLKEQMAVSIIGGADGPTSIFLAGKIGGNIAVMGMIAGIIVLAVGIFLLMRKK